MTDVHQHCGIYGIWFDNGFIQGNYVAIRLNACVYKYTFTLFNLYLGIAVSSLFEGENPSCDKNKRLARDIVPRGIRAFIRLNPIKARRSQPYFPHPFLLPTNFVSFFLHSLSSLFPQTFTFPFF